MKKAGLLFLVMIVIAVVAAGIGYWKLTGEESDTLRKIVLEECLPNQQQNQNPSPCAEVKPNAGYVVLKDLNGPLQYLLMPTYRINGTESPLLTDPSTPNFFWLAWQARDFMRLNLQSKCNKKRSTHQLEYNFVSTQKPFPNDEYFLPTSYNKRARKDNDFTRTGQKTSRNCQSTGT